MEGGEREEGEGGEREEREGDGGRWRRVLHFTVYMGPLYSRWSGSHPVSSVLYYWPYLCPQYCTTGHTCVLSTVLLACVLSTVLLACILSTVLLACVLSTVLLAIPVSSVLYYWPVSSVLYYWPVSSALYYWPYLCPQYCTTGLCPQYCTTGLCPQHCTTGHTCVLSTLRAIILSLSSSLVFSVVSCNRPIRLILPRLCSLPPLL